jgi:hypothetical protein
MIKKLTVIVLSVIILLHTLQVAVLFAWFYMNQDYIIANFCENRDKPELLCSGKCYVYKELHPQTDRWGRFHKEYQKTISLSFSIQSEWLNKPASFDLFTLVAGERNCVVPCILVFDDDLLPQVSGRGIFKPPA